MPAAEAYRWRCACCGEEHLGLPMAMGFDPPLVWAKLDEATRQASYADTDFCIICHSPERIDRYIHCQLPLPVPQMNTDFYLGVWVSVSEKSWKIYTAGYGSGSYAEQGCFGFLSNEIPDFESSTSLHANVWFHPDGLRPILELHETDHPLVKAQREGIEPVQIERWASMMHQPPEA